MKVKDLIKKLQECDPEETVIIAKDAGGNRFSPLSDIGRDLYRPNSSWYGTLIEYERYREEGDLDVVTLWSVN